MAMAISFGGIIGLTYIHYYPGPCPVMIYPEPPEVPVQTNDWVLDSGATSHCTNTRDWLEDVKPVPPKLVTFANGESTVANVAGTADTNGNGFKVDDVLYLPGTKFNLISVGCLTDTNHTVVFRKSGCEVYDESGFKVEGNIRARGQRAENGHYKLIPNVPVPLHSTLWHRRLGHIDMNDLLLLQNRLATGIRINNEMNQIMCSIRCFDVYEGPGGPLNVPAYNLMGQPRATRLLQIVYFYWSGPYYASSLDGHRYYVIFIDDYSRKSFVYFFKKHTQLEYCVLSFRNSVQSTTGYNVEIMKTAQDSTSLKRDLIAVRQCMIKNNIRYGHTYGNNDVINESRSEINRKMMCFIKDAKMNFSFWAEAVSAVVSLGNITPNKAFSHMTPEEIWSGNKPDLSVIRVFGCTAYSHTFKKFAIHSKYDEEKRLYRLIDPHHFGSYYDSNVVFYEDRSFYDDHIFIFP